MPHFQFYTIINAHKTMIQLLKSFYAKFRVLYNRLFPFKIVNQKENLIKYIYSSKNYFKKIPLSEDTPYLLKEEFENFENRIEEVYVALLPTSGYKDPNTGYLITHANQVIKSSIPYSNWTYPWAFHPLPNKFDLHFKRYDVIKFDTIISCDFIFRFGDNYFHFFNSFIGQLALLEKHGVDLSLPILVPKNIIDGKYLDELKRISPKIKNLNLINSTKRKILFEKAFFAKTNPYSISTLSLVSEFLNLNSISSKNINEPNIFLNRKEDKIRNIKNIEEIRAIIKKNGFKEVLTDNISLQKQIELFRSVKNIISIHGAGLTNLLFRHPEPVNLLEIFASNQIVAGYATIVNESNGNYMPFLGSEEDLDHKFYINPQQFEQKIEEWIISINQKK